MDHKISCLTSKCKQPSSKFNLSRTKIKLKESKMTQDDMVGLKGSRDTLEI